MTAARERRAAADTEAQPHHPAAAARAVRHSLDPPVAAALAHQPAAGAPPDDAADRTARALADAEVGILMPCEVRPLLEEKAEPTEAEARAVSAAKAASILGDMLDDEKRAWLLHFATAASPLRVAPPPTVAAKVVQRWPAAAIADAWPAAVAAKRQYTL